VFLSSQLERAISGLANITMAYLIVKLSMPHTTAQEKMPSLLKLLLKLLALVVAEGTVAWQDLLASRIALTFARQQPTTCLLHQLLSVEPLRLATLGLMIYTAMLCSMKTFLRHIHVLVKATMFFKQLLALQVLVVAEGTVAWQNPRVGPTDPTFARHRQTMNLLNKLLSVATPYLATPSLTY
jgi:hypothetical protein